MVVKSSSPVNRGLEVQSHPIPDLGGGGRGCKFNRWPMANDSVSHNYVMEPA